MGLTVTEDFSAEMRHEHLCHSIVVGSVVKTELEERDAG